MATDRIGIIFVHGIGEQRRFEHLDSEVRPLIDALRRRQPDELTIEILAGGEAPLRADQDTWTAQPVRAIIHEGNRRTHIFFHEVWWADVNEPYSFKKEVNFWFWGLSVWFFPNGANKLPGAGAMEFPEFPEEGRENFLARLKLFIVCNLFLMGAITVGALTFLAKRLFNFSAPKFVRIFVNYVSAVKLYVQQRRADGGFLDAYKEPPRVSIRRRMIRTLADVGAADYDRWYVLAHSLGSVVAYNGVMENAQALPNYLDEARWLRLVEKHLAGSGKGEDGKPLAYILADHKKLRGSLPARPVWLRTDDVVFREKLFKNFRGLLTYGSPLDKFAAIWPGRVPINVKEKALSNAEWINVFDPTDPVAADLDAFSHKDADLTPRNLGYAAFWVLLYSHLRYLRGAEGRTDCLVDRVVEWILSGDKFSLPKVYSPWLWFEPTSYQRRVRRVMAILMAMFVGLFLIWLGAVILPEIIKGLIELGARAMSRDAKDVMSNLHIPSIGTVGRMVVLTVAVMFVVFAAGAGRRVYGWLFPGSGAFRSTAAPQPATAAAPPSGQSADGRKAS